MAERRTLGVGILGAGFIGNFHVDSFRGVRDGDIVAVCSRRLERAADLAAKAEALDDMADKAEDIEEAAEQNRESR